MGNNQAFSNEKLTLRDKLTAIILLETAKPYKEMDSDLVSECVEFLMDLEGTKRLTTAEIEQKINDIPFKGKITAIKKHTKKKVIAKRLIIIAAVLAILLSIFCIVAISSETPFERFINDMIDCIVFEMKPGEHKNIDNIELIKHDKSLTFSSVKEFAEHENIEILFPSWLPENNKITEISYYSEDTLGELYVLYCGDAAYSIQININKTVAKDIQTANLSKKVGEHTVYIFADDGFAQGIFDYNGSCYTVSAYTEEEVLKIIESFKEIN